MTQNLCHAKDNIKSVHIEIKKKICNQCFKKSAFTLAELLVAILIISIILVLFAPVITKRATDNFRMTQIKNSTHLFLYDKNDPDCNEIAGTDNALECTFTVPDGVKEINALVVSGGGGGAGATLPTIEYGKKITVTNSTVGSSKTQELKITRGMKNLTISYLTGGGGGGGGGAYEQTSGGAPQSQADCDPYQAKFLTAAQNGKPVCVTKFNIGDIPGAANGGIAASVTVVSAGQNCSAGACCWKGQTAPGDSSGTSYSGLNRTACTWDAANYSCNALAYSGTKAGDWRLPTRDELSKWASNLASISRNQGDNGLRLCDAWYGYGSAACGTGGGCLGSHNSNCYTHHVWASTPNSSNNYYERYLAGGSFNETCSNSRQAYSARCVLEGGIAKYSSLSGGGGGASPYLKNYQIPDNIISNNIDGKIVMYAAKGGNGGSAASSSGANAASGSDGGTSYIYVYNKSNVLKWGLKVPGGKGGGRAAAASSAAGTGGTQKNADTCQIYNGTSWTSTNCTGYGAGGNNGNKITDSNSAAQGGAGGGSMYNSSSLTGGGAGGSNTGENGYNGTLSGAGGGGGTVRFQTSGSNTTAYRGTGGKGANGLVEITYDLTYRAAGGGGGGGGAFALVKNIPVASAGTYTVRVGAGGAGGAISSKGSNGGTSSVTFDSATYSLSGGKGGLAGTSETATGELVQGTGGQKGIVSTNVSDKSKLTYKHGYNGANAGEITINAANPYGGSYGGTGGTSGLDVKGGCGGMFIDSTVCSNTTVNGTYVAFISPGDVFEASEYGSAGAGGGGGGWSENTTFYPNPGSGAQGQNGYVYLYWVEY